MAQIALSAGSSTSVSITAGNWLLISGSGTYRVGPLGTSQRPSVDQLIDETTVVGPFSDVCPVTIFATGGGAAYEMVAPTDAVGFNGKPASVSGARKIVPWDTTSAELQRAHDAAVAAGYSLDLAGATYNITDPVTFRSAALSIDGNDAVLDCANMTGNYGIRLDSTAADASFGNAHRSIRDLKIVGPGRDVAGTKTGVLVSGSAALRSPRPHFYDLSINGFGFGMDLGDYAYLAAMYGTEIFSCHRGLRQLVGVDSGENTSMHGGAIYNCDEYCVETLDESSEINFHGTSFDYSSRFFKHSAGRLALYGCHIESQIGSGLLDDAIDIDGDGTDFYMSGGYLLCAGSAPTTLNQLFNIRNANATAMLHGVFVHNWGNTANKLKTGPGSLRMVGTKGYANSINANPTRISDVYADSLLADGDFETSSIRDFWAITKDNTGAPTDRFTSTNATLTQGASFPLVGSKVLVINKTGAQAVEVTLVMPMTKGGRVSGKFSYYSESAGMQASTTWQAGYAKLNGTDANGIPIVQSTSVAATASVTPAASWNSVSVRIPGRAPVWADCCFLRLILPTAGTGNLRLDDVWFFEW